MCICTLYYSMLCPPMPPSWISEKSDAGSVTQWISFPPQDLWSIFFLHIPLPEYVKRRTLAQWRSELFCMYNLLIFAILFTYLPLLLSWVFWPPWIRLLYALLSSFNHALNGRLIAVYPPPPCPPHTLGSVFPSLCLPSLSRTVSPLFPHKKHSIFFLYI